MEKLKIAVLFGGCSSEYSISLQSAYSVITSLDRNKYDVIMLGITEDGRWLRYRGEPDAIISDSWYRGDCVPAIISPDRSVHGIIELGGAVRQIRLDAAFPVLHGPNGEDGTVQGLIELAGIPLAGCDTLSSALCMNKDFAHRLAAAAGVKVPGSVTLYRGDIHGSCVGLTGDLSYPLFVKPTEAGSSYGISKIHTPDELDGAIRRALDYGDEVIIEESVPGFEVGCAVLGESDLVIGSVDEIEIAGELFDFVEKYNLITSKIHTPARVSPEKADEIRRTAALLYRTLGCRSFARVDMFLRPDGEIVFNEINTIPGFTSHSRYPSMMAHAGMAFGEILDRIIAIALN